MAFAVKSGGTPAGPAEAGLPDAHPRISAFRAIHSELFDRRPLVGSQIRAQLGVRMASLESRLQSRAAAQEAETATSTRDHASFDERFSSSFDERFGDSFDERFGPVLEKRPREADESVVFGGPAWPMPFADALQAPLRAFASPVELHTNDVVPSDPARRETAPPVIGRPAPGVATVTPPSLPPASQKLVRTADAGDDAILPSDSQNHTAIYDISAHAVYLPNGDRLEAHSGLGGNLDNPNSVGVRGRGPTPPNVYDLVLRKQLFHGVRAIRLVPVGEAKMFGRDGMLAHSYMLGPNGQSNGCVSFSNYPAFLNAYLKGDVDRLVVVEHLATAPTPRASSGWLPEALRNLFNPS
ncbi:MAG TPA: DUF2778 domain-containing protein [Xanthobacteraceae bacterium]|nr:DUF2778 domain-containing protein [Xanthobacteraceae bacterium]